MSQIEIIWVYIIGVLTISLGIGSFVSYHYSKESKVWQAFPTFYTFFPALIAIIVQAFYAEPITFASWGFRVTGSWKFYVLAFILPFGYLGLHTLVQFLIKNYSLIPDIKWNEIILAAILQQIILPIFIMGEEIGWRGFLQNRLLAEYNMPVTIIVLGIVWGIWHAPVALKGYNLPNHPKFEAYIFYPFACIVYSTVLVYLTLTTNSILPAILFHTTNNNLAGLSMVLFDKKDERKEIFSYLVVGMIVLVIFIFLLSQ